MMLIGGMEVLVLRKPIKNLHLSVLPPNGRIRVTSPLEVKDSAIRSLIATRLSWIHKQQNKFAEQERQTFREYVSGESHYLFGKRFKLERVEVNAAPQVSQKGVTKLLLQVRPGTTPEKCEAVMKDWYRGELHPVIDTYVKKWEKKIGVKAKSVNIRYMKTKWGTCNKDKGAVWFNLELAKKPHSTIEYVVVHELVHLIERTHDERFIALMDKHLPKWRSEREKLNRFILSHETW